MSTLSIYSWLVLVVGTLAASALVVSEPVTLALVFVTAMVVYIFLTLRRDKKSNKS